MGMIDKLICGLLATERLPLPRTAHIEPVGNICQLTCPLCPVGTGKLGEGSKMMSLEAFTFILEKMPFLRTLDLYRSGEPFLNPEIMAMIRHASDRNIKVVISTNFSFSKPDRFFEELVGSGLDRVVVSLDGASQEGYASYRVGGNYEQVVANIEKLVQARHRARSKKPEIIWQFLVNRFNESDIAAAQELSGKLGVKLDLKPISLADNEPDMGQEGTIEERKRKWLPKDSTYVSDCYKGEYTLPLSKGICRDLFTRVVVTADGGVFPCCDVWDNRNVFGNLVAESFRDIWYSAGYLAARRRFLQPGYQPQAPSICYKCNNYGINPPLREKAALLLAVYRKWLRFW